MSNDWQNTVEFARAVRRELHLNPELSWHEHETAARIRQILDELHIRWRSTLSRPKRSSIAQRLSRAPRRARQRQHLRGWTSC